MKVDWQDAWQDEQTRAKRERTDRAVTSLQLDHQLGASVALLVRQLARVASPEGATWIGVRQLAERLERTERRVWQLLAEARAAGWIQRIWQGGGCHRTTRYLLRVGAWRDDAHNPHMQHDFAERRRAALERIERWYHQLFVDHLGLGRRCCEVFAPRALKNPEIDWIGES